MVLLSIYTVLKSSMNYFFFYALPFHPFNFFFENLHSKALLLILSQLKHSPLETCFMVTPPFGLNLVLFFSFVLLELGAWPMLHHISLGIRQIDCTIFSLTLYCLLLLRVKQFGLQDSFHFVCASGNSWSPSKWVVNIWMAFLLCEPHARWTETLALDWW